MRRLFFELFGLGIVGQMSALPKKAVVVLLIALMLGAVQPLAADEIVTSWSNHEIKLAPKPDRAKPPVITTIAIQPGGAMLAIAGDDHWVRLHDARTGDVIRVLTDHVDWVRSVAFSPDGHTLATAGNDRRILLWSVETGDLKRVLTTHKHAITNVAFSNDGRLLAVAGFGHSIHVYEIETGRKLHELGCSCCDMRAVAFSPDDRLVAAGGRDGTIRIWNVQSGQQVRDLRGHRGRVRSLVFCRGGGHIASCSDDRQVRISSVNGQESFALPRRSAKVLSLTFYGKEKLATGGSDNRIRLWDVEARREMGQEVY